MGGPFGNRGNTESREQTIANGEFPFLLYEIISQRTLILFAFLISLSLANRKIQSIATVLRLSDVVSLAATRLYTLAVEHKFTKGRKSLNVVAVCLYVACRQKETRNYMLIDFSDLLQVKSLLALCLESTPSSPPGQCIRTWTHISPTCANPQSTLAPGGSLPLHLSLCCAVRVW
jgi:hypothetical protein